jgi:hypothetical protein
LAVDTFSLSRLFRIGCLTIDIAFVVPGFLPTAL